MRMQPFREISTGLTLFNSKGQLNQKVLCQYMQNEGRILVRPSESSSILLGSFYRKAQE